MSSDTPEFDLDRLNLPDDDADALRTLANLQDEVRPTRITPRGERFPPVAPQAKTTTRASHAPDADAAQVSSTTDANSIQNLLYNSITALALLGSAGVIVWIALIWQAPHSAWNPLPPPTPYIYVTATPSGNAAASEFPTPNAAGQIIIVATETPAAIARPAYPFITQDIIYAPNENDLGCDWMSIAGTVTDRQSNPLNGFRIRVQGDDFDESVFSGTALTFGAGGYELPLPGAPSARTYTVQLLSTRGMPLTDEIRLETRAGCDSNVAILNFVQVDDDLPDSN